MIGCFLWSFSKSLHFLSLIFFHQKAVPMILENVRFMDMRSDSKS